jgi:hypothetical protein
MERLIEILPLAVGMLIGIPCIAGILITFIAVKGRSENKKTNRKEYEYKILEEKKKILELEIEKQNNQLKLLEAESKNLDKIIFENNK